MRFRYLISAVLLAGCVHVPPVVGQCLNTTNTCGSSVTANLSMCRLPVGCKNPDYASNLENALIDIDTLFAAATTSGGHAHRGTSGDGPKLDASMSFDCTNSPSSGQCLSWSGSKCTWTTCGSGGGGSGDVVGPASSVDRRIAVFDGTTGKLIADNGDWKIPGGLSDPDLLGSINVRIGMGDTTPDAVVDVDNASSVTLPSFGARCTGAVTATSICNEFNNITTSGVAAIKASLFLRASGTFNAAGAHAIGAYCDVQGGTNSDCIYSQAGNIILANDNKLGVGDDTPTAHVEIAATDNANALAINTSGVITAAHQAAVINNVRTGGDGASIKSALQLTSSGVYNGINTAIFASASGGTSGNYGVAVAAGDITIGDGVLTSASSNNRNEFNCLGANSSCLRVSDNAINSTDILEIIGSGTNPFGVDIEITGSGSGQATGFEMDVDNPNASIVGFHIRGTGESGSLLNLEGTAESDSADFQGNVIAIDGAGSSGTLIGTGVVMTNGEKPVAFSGQCSQTVGSSLTPCASFTTVGDDAGDFFGLRVGAEANNGSADATGLVVTATNGGGRTIAATFAAVADNVVDGIIVSASGGTTNRAATFTAGDVIMGDPTSTEQFHWHQTDNQFVLHVLDGVADNVGASVIELHNEPGEIALDVIGTSDGTNGGVALRTTITGAVTNAATSAQISNGQTSSTNAINKVGLQVNSTGSFSGTGAVNAAVQASATGGTLNYAIDALQGGMRTDWILLKPQGGAPFTCAAAHAGMLAYAAADKLTCVCSDSDGSSFEWEAIEDRTHTCTF